MRVSRPMFSPLRYAKGMARKVSKSPPKIDAGNVIHRLPGLLREIAAFTDLDTAMKVAAAKGGQRAYIPRVPRKGHWLSEAVGMEAAARIGAELCPAQTGLEFEIPKGLSLDNPNVAEVERLTLAGVPKMSIADVLGIHHRTVQKYRARLRREGRLPPYDTSGKTAPRKKSL